MLSTRLTRATLGLIALTLVFAAPPALATGGGTPEPLRILLTNDDGWDAPGIQALRGALLGAGHDVLLVAPLEGQSGKGGALNTGVGEFVEVIEQAPGQWSVDSTPSDAIRAALGAILPGLGLDPPDLIISGCNFGQNLAQTGTAASGTIGAALQGLFSDLPAVACSVGLDFAEFGSEPIPFPSTFAAFGPASDFMVRLVARLQRSRHGDILPRRTALNVNFPVPYDDIEGVKVVPLARGGDFEFVWQDVQGVIPSGGGGVLINIATATEPDPVRKSDTNAYLDGFITITPIDGDMTSNRLIQRFTKFRLHGLRP
jgi:5'/3'-nucleotidase SurE